MDIKVKTSVEVKNALEEFLESLEEEDALSLEDEADTLEDEEHPTYKVIRNNKLKEGDEPLSNVIGLESQKKELLLMIDWFNRSQELKNQGIVIPKGLILHGGMGNGKSLLISEIIKCCNAPVYVYKGGTDNVTGDIQMIFDLARKEPRAIVVFDEFDLLLNKDRRLIRVFQENLDGLDTNGNLFVLTATNNIEDVPAPLLRSGRLERVLEITPPDPEDAIALLKRFFKSFNVEFPNDVDEYELGLTLSGASCANMKAIANDIFLRNGFDKITYEMIDESACNVLDRKKEYDEDLPTNFDVAVHESGHCVMANAFKEHFSIGRLTIQGVSGRFKAKEVQKGFWPYDKALADIKISLAGLIAQKVICGQGSRGSYRDLQEARSSAYNLINISGYLSCWETLPVKNSFNREETQFKRRHNERKIERLLHRCEKEVTKYVKKNKEKIYKLATALYEKKTLKCREILSIIG